MKFWKFGARDINLHRQSSLTICPRKIDGAVCHRHILYTIVYILTYTFYIYVYSLRRSRSSPISPRLNPSALSPSTFSFNYPFLYIFRLDFSENFLFLFYPFVFTLRSPSSNSPLIHYTYILFLYIILIRSTSRYEPAAQPRRLAAQAAIIG